MPLPLSLRCGWCLGLAILGPLVGGWALEPLPARAESAPAAVASTTPTLGPALNPSTAAQLALVEHLRQAGVVFYGAWWCPACFKQKNLFGQQAGNQLPYQECEKTEEQRQRCQKTGIGAYPTWVMGEQRLEGVQTLERLGRWSGYKNSDALQTPKR